MQLLNSIPHDNLMYVGIAILFVGLIMGYIISLLRVQGKLSRLKEDNIRLTVTLEVEKKQHENYIHNQGLQKQQLNESFQVLSSSVLRQSNRTFLRLAKENLGQYQVQAKAELEKKEHAFDSLIKPIRETLEKTHLQIHNMEKDRRESQGALNKHLESMAETQKNLHSETRNLVKAFHRPEVRGQWGELTLKRLAELAGMVEHCDFEEQVSTSDDEGAMHRPDMIVRLPNNREIIVDSKTPLDAYLDAVEATDEASKEQALMRHVRHVKQRIKELSGKAYWEQFDRTPDFVVLFIPGDQFLNAALDKDRHLIEDALSKKVILSTPTSFVALLRAVAFGWRQETMTENAEKIRILGEEMYGRMATFSESLSKVGKSLGQSVDSYNKTVATFTGRILPTAKKFKEMGVQTKKDVAEVEPLDRITREIEKELIE